MTFNIKGLPAAINFGYRPGRYDEIGRYLAERHVRGDAPDLVLIQESFALRTRELFKYAGYPYVLKGPGQKSIDVEGRVKASLLSSGLYILSKFPMEKVANIAFSARSCRGFDCFANKGVQMVRVKVPGVPMGVEVLNTHLQADDDKDLPRKKQLSFVKKFLTRHRSETASIFAGDFNTYPKLESYALLKDITNMQNVGEHCLQPGNACRVDSRTDARAALYASVDHILYHQGRGLKLEPISLARFFVGKRFSDHMAYESDFELRW